METRKVEKLKAAGMDVEGALERFMGSDALLERFLKKFLEDTNFETLVQALDARDLETATRSSHTLKGMCANLSFSRLYKLFTRQVQLLREEDSEKAADMMPEISQAYALLVDAIKGLDDEA